MYEYREQNQLLYLQDKSSFFTKHSRSKFANILADLPLFGGKHLCHFQEAISSRVRPQFIS